MKRLVSIPAVVIAGQILTGCYEESGQKTKPQTEEIYLIPMPDNRYPTPQPNPNRQQILLPTPIE
jgi:hypothetical protein